MSQHLTAVALVAMTQGGQPVSGAIAFLKTSDGKELLTDTTNTDGYMVFNNVPVPFVGVVRLAGAVQFYQQNVSITGDSVTLRCGPSPSSPQDIQLPAVSPFKKPLPSVPSREAVCNGQLTAQAVTIHSLVYGDMPWWPACWAWLTKDDRAHIAPQLLALGDTIMLIDVPSSLPLYDEMGQFYQPSPSPEYPLANFGGLVYDPPALANLVAETLGYGFAACWVFLDGDASYDLACFQVEDIAPIFASYPAGNLNQFVMYVPGWDGTWHKPNSAGTGYTPQQVYSFSQRARAAGALYLGFEHGTGYAPVGEGGGDYQDGGNMSLYDAVLGEFNSGEFTDDVWQIHGRFCRPYNRPPEQPAGDDPNPPYYLATPSARGPYFYHRFEWCMYVAVRGESQSVMDGWKAQFVTMAPTTRVC